AILQSGGTHNPLVGGSNPSGPTSFPGLSSPGLSFLGLSWSRSIAPTGDPRPRVDQRLPPVSPLHSQSATGQLPIGLGGAEWRRFSTGMCGTPFASSLL